jgi:toxin-antitoxin system PIN domain toxin
MRFLLDVNALVALGAVEHQFHAAVTEWLRKLRLRGVPVMLTCSITELGFVRVLSNTTLYGFTVSTAADLLVQMKTREAGLFRFIPDDRDASHLPRWVAYPKQVTDGHLVKLAQAHDAVLATLDRRIPGALRISA